MIKQYKIPFHYLNTVHQDLILKMNYDNIMEVPRFTKTICVIKHKPLSLALEMFSGQKLKQQVKLNQNKMVQLRFQMSSQNESFLSTMRNDIMYNCVDKLLTVASMHDCFFKIYSNQIQLAIKAKQFYLFSEIQNHLELFEVFFLKDIHFVLYTSSHEKTLSARNQKGTKKCLTKKETVLLWTSIFTKPF